MRADLLKPLGSPDRRNGRGTPSGCLLFATLLLAASLLPTGASHAEVRELVILYTNDFHSAIDPIPAYWMAGDPPPHLGGAANLMTLVEKIRHREAERGVPVFLFDTGDMFTGMLAKLTRGEALMEMMTTLDYDALAIGNHEFDYGWQNFREQMFRVAFPVLGANIFYAGTDIPFSPPHAIIERGGIRIGAIGIIGEDAKSVVLPSFVSDLRFEPPAPHVAASIAALENDVDLIVVLAHQGHTGPMQTDAEAHPELQRDFFADIDLCGQVAGIDVFVGGHAHRGIEIPFVHPQNKSLIVQTYGYGTRLGFLRLRVDTDTGEVVEHDGELIKVWSDQLPPDPRMLAKMKLYQDRVAPTIGPVVGHSAGRLVRSYNTESPLGSYSSDVLRQITGSDVAFMNAGGLRDDLPAGAITIGDVQDAFPFFNTVAVQQMTGAQVAAILEQGFTLLRGMIQVSGLRARYDLERPVGERLVNLEIGGRPMVPDQLYRVASNSFLAEGGDLYEGFLCCEWIDSVDQDVAQVIIDDLSSRRTPVPVPERGRLVPVN